MVHSIRSEAPFAFGGRAPFLPLPGLCESDIGPITLPLQAAQVRELTAVGRKVVLLEKTSIVETILCQYRRIYSSRLSFSAHWSASVAVLANDICSKLKLSGPICPHFSHLSLFEPNSFMLPVVQNGRIRSVATLLILLPSKFSGGTLFVSHLHREAAFDFSTFSDSIIQYAVYLPGSRIQIERVKKGVKLCLFYSLISSSSCQPQDINKDSTDVNPLHIYSIWKALSPDVAPENSLFPWSTPTLQKASDSQILLAVMLQSFLYFVPATFLWLALQFLCSSGVWKNCNYPLEQTIPWSNILSLK